MSVEALDQKLQEAEQKGTLPKVVVPVQLAGSSCNMAAIEALAQRHDIAVMVSMYVLDTDRHHSPHIHIRYAEHKVVVRIPDGEILDGSLPVKQMKLVQAWVAIHQDELMADWQLASEGQAPFKIDPLR